MSPLQQSRRSQSFKGNGKGKKEKRELTAEVGESASARHVGMEESSDKLTQLLTVLRFGDEVVLVATNYCRFLIHIYTANIPTK